MKPILVLCLGNELLSDDSFGPRVADILTTWKLPGEVDIVSVSQAGFNLIDFLAGRESILIIDAIVTGKARPGTVHFFPMERIAHSWNLAGSHEIDLPTAIRLGRLLGLTIPDDINVLAVESKDLETLSESLTEPVASALGESVELISQWVNSKIEKRKEYAKRKERSPVASG